MSSIYIHIPFCEHKCVYCDFYSVEDHSTLPDFINALIEEIRLSEKFSKEEDIETVYFGGGTPSLLRPKDLDRLFDTLHSNFVIKKDAEITLEANPGTVSLKVLSEFKQLGINRLSIGIQSFNDEELKFLSRIHSAEDGYKTYNQAREAGFNNISIDLIYALPRQTLRHWEETLVRSASLMPEHISAYNLTIENGTPLGRMVQSKIVSPLPDEDEALLFKRTMEFLQYKGYIHYEVSNYAKPGYQSKHNMNYWNHAQYLGFGPSAHSFWGKKRWWNVSDISKYIRSLQGAMPPIEDSEILTSRQELDEMIMLGLRTGGLNIDKLAGVAGHSINEKSWIYIEQLIIENLILKEENTIRLTDRGFLFCDEIAERLSSCV